MSTKPIAAWGLFITAGLNLIAAALPMAEGGRINGVFLGAAVVFFGVGAATLRKYNASKKREDSGT